MQYFHQDKTALTHAQLTMLSSHFEALTDVAGLARLLGTTEANLLKHANKPEYHTFFIPKPGGQKRKIDHPASALKTLQQSLNRYLQATYYGVRPPHVHGFSISPKDDFSPRNIYTNALQHTKSEWFLNIDLKDFFHTVTTTHLKDLFRYTFFFPPDLTAVLTKLLTFNGRLPMGAPTSPAMSNWASIFFDFDLEHLAKQHKNTIFTRYADDITFSFSTQPSAHFLEEVRRIVLKHSFVVNEQKIRLQSRMEQPEVTGLVLGKGVLPVLSPSWLKRLKSEIKVFQWLMSEAVRERGLFHAYVFDRFRQSVQGQVAFVGFVLGKNNRDYRKMAVKVGM